MDCKYTWYVNIGGDIQVYENFVEDKKFWDFGNLNDAQEHKIDWFLQDPNKWAKVKYFIPSEYAKAFFTCLQLLPQLFGDVGYTNVELSDFLD